MVKRYFSPLSNIDFNTYGGRFKKGVVNGGIQQTTKGSTFSLYADDIILSTDYTGAYDSLSPGNINLIPTGAVFIGNSVTPPTDTPSNGGYLYADDGVLTYKDSTGTVSNMNLNSITTFSELQSLTGPITVYVRQGTAITATSSYTVPSNVNIIFLTGSSIYANSGVRVHFSGAIQSDHRCFFGPGFCSVSQVPINPLWWGGNSDSIAWECRFDKPGLYNTGTYYASDGAAVVCTRAGTVNYFDNGASSVASANQMRITGNGILVEPAATQILTSTDFTSALWVGGTQMPTKTGGQADPAGGLTAFLIGEGVANSGHQVYNLVTLSGTTVYSVYAKYGSARYVRITDNSTAHVLKFDFTTQTVTVTGAGASGYAEEVGGGWYRLVLVMTTPTSGLVGFSHFDDAGSSATFTGTNRYTYLWRPQCEAQALGRPTTWISSGSRSADVITVSGPKVFDKWCIDVDFRTAETFDRIGLCPLLSVGTYSANESICLALNTPQSSKFSIIDSNGEKYTSQTTTVSGTGGVCVSASFSNATPAIKINGASVKSTTSGDGYGLYRGVYPLAFRVGQASTGLQSSFEIKRIAVRGDNDISTIKADFIYNYNWALGQKGISRNNMPIFLGDSNTQGTGSGLIPYSAIACSTKGAAYVHQNYGIGGNTTVEIRNRYSRELSNAAVAGYRQIFIWAGINDVNNLISPSVSINNLLYVYNSVLDQGLNLIPITVMAGSNAATLANIQTINAFIADYCSAGSGYRGASSSSIYYIDAFSLLGDNGSNSTKIATIYDNDGGSLHINQVAHNLLGAYAAALIW
jgi:hypothetical protein